MELSKEEISTLVKRGRLNKGCTQQELADLAGISLRSVQRIENAEVLPRLYTLKVLADNLGFMDELNTVEPTNFAVLNNEAAIAQSQLNKPRKLILSISAGLLLILLTGAFLSQATRFPETNFELFVLLFAVVGIYAVFLFKLWK